MVRRSIDDEWKPSKGSCVIHEMDPGICECCGSMDGVEAEDSRTSYCWNGEGEDPNRSVFLCRLCALVHHDFWDEQWDEYNRGRL